jgi:hypothetical protein
MWEMKNTYKFWLGNLKVKYNMGDLGIDRRII